MILAALCTSQAFAQSSYTHTAAKRSYCSSMGGISRVVFEGKERGDSKEKYLDMSKSMLDAGDRSAEILRFSIDYGYDKATDSQDAHMSAWANCMDRIN